MVLNSLTPDVFVYLSSERADSASHNQDWEREKNLKEDERSQIFGAHSLCYELTL